jgi:AcrR family transcriptional regulator
MKPTKQYIAEKALTLFNEKGMANVRLQHIADSAFVSIGHLAYHFKNKEAIITTLYKKLKKGQELILTEFRVLPLFEDIDLFLDNVFQLQQQYRFFYLDTLDVLRAFPEIAEKHRQLLNFQRQQMHFMIEFNFSRGAFTSPKYDEQYTDIANSFCIMMDTWMNYQFIEGKTAPDKNTFHKDLWSILRVLFTNMGDVEFRQLGNLTTLT